MIYPKCLYKTREKTTVAADEAHHMKLAKEGWKDIWTDKQPNQFVELAKKKYEERKALLKELKEDLEKEDQEEKERLAKEKKEVKDGNGKNNTKGGPKAS